MVADRRTTVLVDTSMALIVASRANVRLTKELLEWTREALTSSRELLDRTSSFSGSSGGD